MCLRLAADTWEIPAQRVQLFANKKLGSGAFGEVYAGWLVGDAAIKQVYSNVMILAKFCDCEVAIKTLPLYADEDAKKELQQVEKNCL